MTPQKRVLPARERRESAAKRRASSPGQSPALTPTSNARKPPTPAQSAEPRQKRKYTKRASLVRVQTPASRSSPSVSVAEEALPTRITANKPLPTSKQTQPSNLSLHEYQSIAESAILSASLHRSRMQWLCEGIFQKYWVKPVKRKGVIEAPPNNPDSKSMQRLGSATITIEPHTFDAIFYTVRDPSTPAPLPYQRHPNQHTAKNMIHHPPPYGMYPPPSPHQHPRPPAPPPPPPPSASSQMVGPLPAGPPSTSGTPPTAKPPPLAKSIPPFPSPAPSQTPAQNGSPPDQIKQEEASGPSSAAPPASQTPSSAPSPREQSQTPRPSQRPNPPAPSGRGSTTDPVIQMLAARAASDPQLKELMKVVATSKASPEQLKEFQAHIDEFNEVIRRQEAERVSKNEDRLSSRQPSIPSDPPPTEKPKDPLPDSKPPTPNPPTPGRATPNTAASVHVPNPTPSPAPVTAQWPCNSTHTHPQALPPPPPSSAAVSRPGPLPGAMHTFPHPPPPAGRGVPLGGYVGYPPPPRSEPIIKHIVLEMTSIPSGGQSACTDRWLFPEHAVLEIHPSGLEMICSFFVERRGSQILNSMGAEAAEGPNGTPGGKWQAEQEYYQAVTMTIKAMNHRTIETIARAAKLLPEVQEHMKNVMANKERAPVEYLVHQLPRERSPLGGEGTETGFVDSGVDLADESDSEDDELKEVYGI